MPTFKRSPRNWREFVITPLVEIFILTVSAGGIFCLSKKFSFDILSGLVLFYLQVILVTLVVLFVVRHIFPIHRGIHSYLTNPWGFYGWRLHDFLCSTNLSFQYNNALLPPILRKYFYRLLGVHFDHGVIYIGGRILDPYLVRVQQGARLGDETLLRAHDYAVGTSDMLILDHIDIGKGAVIGARSTLMPGVKVGENAMVKAMSIVQMNTKIPPNEIWGGNPARKLADVDTPLIENN